MAQKGFDLVHNKVTNFRVDKCSVCGFKVELVMDLPNYPLTGIYGKSLINLNEISFDQSFMFCKKCSHGQLINQLNPEFLYGYSYTFRTNKSESSQISNLNLANWLKNKIDFKDKVVMEFGSNDLTLLKNIDNFKKAYAIDPLLSLEHSSQVSNIKTISKLMEDVTKNDLDFKEIDIVLAIHTFEHIINPKSLLEKLITLTNKNTIFIFEFPCLDNLVRNLRFDQITHQHVQYFSSKSINKLLNKLNFKILYQDLDGEIYGSMRVIFTLNHNSEVAKSTGYKNKQLNIDLKSLASAKNKYFNLINLCREKLIDYEKRHKKIMIYGAGQTLSTLTYQLPELKRFHIVDDDVTKNNLYYPGFLYKISSLVEPLNDDSHLFFIGALEARKVIFEKIRNLGKVEIMDLLEIK